MRSKIVTTIAFLLAATAVTPALAADDPQLLGRWSEPFWEGGSQSYDPPSLEKAKQYPVAVTLIALPDGRLLYWNGIEGSENADLLVFNSDGTSSLENSRTRILDLRSGQPQWTVPNKERGTTDEPKDQGSASTKDLFCADQKLLYDGTVLIAGGTEYRFDIFNDPVGSDIYGDDETRIFDPTTDTFTNAGQMRNPRWYPSLVTLADGRVLVASGVKRLGQSYLEPGTSFSQVRETEIFDPTSRTWTSGGTADLSLPLYPRLHLLPDGTVFYGGSGQTWGQFGETPDEATWAVQRTYDPATQAWTLLGPSRYGVRGGTSSTLLRLEAPYDTAGILLAGGTLGPAPGTAAATTLSEVITVTPDGVVADADRKHPLAGLSGDQTQLRRPRWFGTSVMLPTGEVLLVNGGDADETIVPGTPAAVRTAELYDPATGTWRQLATSSRDRVYHSTAVLLPDGRVLVGGNSPEPAYYYRHDNTATRSNNFKDATFEIYEPPYLFRGDRPVVDAVSPVSGGRGLELTLGEGTPAEDISEVVLVRMTAVTHAVDADMRAVKLEHSVDGSTLVAPLPNGGDGRILPPGPYHVFAMRNTPDGPVPSVSHSVLVQPDAAGGGVVVTLP